MVEGLHHLLPVQAAEPVLELYPVHVCIVWCLQNFLTKFKMSTMSRALAKTFLKSLNHYENQKDMVRRAVDPTKPTLVKSHAKNRVKLEEAYSELSYDWKNYKDDLDVTATEFNALEDDEPKYQYNDSWFEDVKTSFYQLLELSDDKLEEPSISKEDVTDTREPKVDILKLKQER